MSKEKMSIEETFAKLEETITQLEKDDISLEDSLKAYEQGMEYIKSCNEAIDKAEKKVLVIRENGELDEF
jgi:exodeoxyribonuclease VII small subunit